MAHLMCCTCGISPSSSKRTSVESMFVLISGSARSHRPHEKTLRWRLLKLLAVSCAGV